MSDESTGLTPNERTLGCNYWHPGSTLECRGDGYLWDADHDGFDPSEKDMACPSCNTLEYLQAAKDEAESTLSGTTYAGAYTGESLWLGAVAVARKANPALVDQVLREIGRVAALRPTGPGPDDYEEAVYSY